MRTFLPKNSRGGINRSGQVGLVIDSLMIKSLWSHLCVNGIDRTKVEWTVCVSDGMCRVHYDKNWKCCENEYFHNKKHVIDVVSRHKCVKCFILLYTFLQSENASIIISFGDMQHDLS